MRAVVRRKSTNGIVTYGRASCLALGEALAPNPGLAASD